MSIAFCCKSKCHTLLPCVFKANCNDSLLVKISLDDHHVSSIDEQYGRRDYPRAPISRLSNQHQGKIQSKDHCRKILKRNHLPTQTAAQYDNDVEI